MNTKSIGSHIKQYRKELGMTQEQFSEQVHLSQNYLSSIERGIKLPRLDTFIEIINALDVSADEVLSDVTKVGYKVKASQLEERICDCPPEKKKMIFDVIEVLLK